MKIEKQECVENAKKNLITLITESEEDSIEEAFLIAIDAFMQKLFDGWYAKEERAPIVSGVEVIKYISSVHKNQHELCDRKVKEFITKKSH